LTTPPPRPGRRGGAPNHKIKEKKPVVPH